MSLDPSQEFDPSADEDEGSAVDDDQFKARQHTEDKGTDEEEKSSHADSETSKGSLHQEENSEAGESTKGSGGTATSQGSFDSVDSLNVEGISLVKRGGIGEVEEHQIRPISPNLLEAQPFIITASTPPLSTHMPSRRNTPDPRATPGSKDEEPDTTDTAGEDVEEAEAPDDSHQDVEERDHVEESQVHQTEQSIILVEKVGLEEETLPETHDSKEPDEINSSLTLAACEALTSREEVTSSEEVTSREASTDLYTSEEIEDKPEERGFHNEDVTCREASTDLYTSEEIEDKPEERSFHKEEQTDPVLSTQFDDDEEEASDVAQEINVYNTVDVPEMDIPYENKQNVFLRTEEVDTHKDDDSFYASAEETVEDTAPGKNSSIRFQLVDSDMEEQTVEIVDDVYSETYAPRVAGLDEHELYGDEQVYKDNLDDEDEHISSVSEHEGDSHDTYVKKQDRHLFKYSPNVGYTLGDSFSQYEKLTRRSLGETDELLSGYQDNSSVVSDVFSPRLESHRQTSLSKLKSKMPKFSTVAYSFKRLKPQVPPPTPPSSPWTVYGDFGGYHLNDQNNQGSKGKKVSTIICFLHLTIRDDKLRIYLSVAE